MRGSILLPANPVARLKRMNSTIIQIFLLFLMMVILIWTLADQIRGLSQVWLIPFMAVGLGSGWIFARSRLAGWGATIAMFSIYLVLVLSWVGQFGRSTFNLFIGLLRSTWGSLYFQDASSFSSLRPLIETFWLGISVPFTRVYQWAEVLASGGTGFDPLVTAILGSALVFTLAAWSAWAVRRRAQPLIAFLPAGSILLIILYLTNSQTSSLVVFIALALCLFALVNHRSNIANWDSHGIGYAEDIHLDLFWILAVLIMLLSLAAHLASILSLEMIYNFSRSLLLESNSQVENLAESFGIDLHSDETDPFGDLRYPGLPRNHLIQAGPELLEEQVMTIRVEGISPLPGAEGTFTAPRLYWRGLTYDQYTGRGWLTSQTNLTKYSAGEVNPGEPAPYGRQISQEIRLVGDHDANEEMILYAAGTPINLSEVRQVAYRSSEDIFGVSGNTRQYRATSLLNEIQEDNLRAHQEAYPDRLLERYLELPDSVPERVRLLALQVTATAPTPYDRAIAIEKYLRTFPYTLDVPAPPPGREVSDYFLFDLKRGYCDYYATTMIVLSRATGLPARLVIGYASGVYDPGKNLYQIRGVDAHSWVEIFFPGYGWITFEPTGGLPAIDRDSASDLPATQSSNSQQVPGFEFPAWFDRLTLPRLTLISFLLGALVLLVWSLADRMLLFNHPPPIAVVSLYRRLLRQGRRLPFPLLPSQTPYEVSTGMGAQLDRLVEGSPFHQVLHPGSDEIADLTEVYVQTIYSPTPPGSAHQHAAIQTWGRLRWRLWLAKWLKRLRRKAV